MKRYRVRSKTGDKKRFSRTAGMTHSKNMRAMPMRGGYRI